MTRRADGAMAATATSPMGSVRRKRRTELEHYPAGGQRFLCLGIVVVATIVLYYQFYLAGAVAAGTQGRTASSSTTTCRSTTTSTSRWSATSSAPQPRSSPA